MMNDLQLLFRLDTGSVTARRTPVPLLEVVSAVIAAHPAGPAGFRPDAVEVDIDDDLSALADRGHVWAVVQNLLRNALQYGSAPVRIRAERTPDVVTLIVEDRGPGIPDDLVPNLFGRFMRGAGLGLFIVRQLVEANGGTVRYERADPCGARLVVTLEAASTAG
jgi:signal transduction histidine kinase